jgi:hypothetical protein
MADRIVNDPHAARCSPGRLVRRETTGGLAAGGETELRFLPRDTSPLAMVNRFEVNQRRKK